MKKFAVKNNYYGHDRILAVLNYDEMQKSFTIDVPSDISEKEVPFLLSSFVKRGQRHVGNEWSLKWVQSRIVPPGRQNIGQILRENGMKRYDEYELLIKNQGRSCQDECYLEQLS